MAYASCILIKYTPALISENGWVFAWLSPSMYAKVQKDLATDHIISFIDIKK